MGVGSHRMTNQLYLYVALIAVGIVLFALTRPKHSAVPAVVPQQRQTAIDHGLKETLDEFMNELERDNARLMDSFVNLQNDYKQKLTNQQQIIRDLQLRMSQLESMITEHVATSEKKSSVPESLLQVTPPGFIFNEKYAKVVELSRQGLTAEQIARATDIGMGEIQMVLGLAKREDS